MLALLIRDFHSGFHACHSFTPDMLVDQIAPADPAASEKVSDNANERLVEAISCRSVPRWTRQYGSRQMIGVRRAWSGETTQEEPSCPNPRLSNIVRIWKQPFTKGPMHIHRAGPLRLPLGWRDLAQTCPPGVATCFLRRAHHLAS